MRATPWEVATQIAPSGASATHAGEVPKGFSSCFQAKNAPMRPPSCPPSETRHYFYLLRLGAFLLIIVGIVAKNRGAAGNRMVRRTGNLPM